MAFCIFFDSPSTEKFEDKSITCKVQLTEMHTE